MLFLFEDEDIDIFSYIHQCTFKGTLMSILKSLSVSVDPFKNHTFKISHS